MEFRTFNLKLCYMIYRTKGITRQMLHKESGESTRTISTQKLGQFPGRGIASDTDKTFICQNVPLFSVEIVVLPLSIRSEALLDLQSQRSMWSWSPKHCVCTGMWSNWWWCRWILSYQFHPPPSSPCKLY